MTDKEIIQALRCCEKEVCADGGLCPLFSDADCIVHLGEAAIDLIERLTAENVALREGASLGKVKRSQKQAYEKQIESLQALANRQLSEIKKLQKDLCWKDLEVDAAEWKQERAEAERDALREKVPQWVSVANRLPELWKNEKTGELINYMVRSPYFGVDIGNYQKEAGTWLCMGLPCTVTHWMPLPEAPEGGMMKGASNFDKLCHQVFDGKNDGTNYLAWETDICCGRCGHKLHVYYCEERLYLIECAVCGTKALTKAGNVVFAAYKTLAHTPKIEEDEK